MERGKRDARDGGRQHEGKIDESVKQTTAGDTVACQRPGDDGAEYGIDRRREQRGEWRS
jgi:hypothetical protein